MTQPQPDYDRIQRELDEINVLESPAHFATVLSRNDAQPWHPYRFLVVINEHLVKLAEGEITRLMITCPPRHGKSLLCSLYFPAWYLNRYPDRRFILTSYGDDYAAEWGRKVRDLIVSNERLLQIRINPTSKAADRWDIEGHAGGMKTAGAGGAITGRGGNIFGIDDPVKNSEEAHSAVDRETKWRWWRTDAHSRLEPVTKNGRRVLDPGAFLILTRWHDDDLTGRILPADYAGENGMIHCRDGRDWYVVCLPAQCEREDDPLGREIGEYLWPEWFSEDHFKPFKAQSRTWNALFQQRPQPEQGTYFQRDWFERFDPFQLPTNLHTYGSSDYAVTDDEKADYTEHGVYGVDSEGGIWIKDWWSGQETADKWIEKQIDMIRRHQPFCWFGEAGVIRRAINPFLQRSMQDRRTYCRMEWIPSVKDKPSRARALQGMASQGKVHLPAGETGDRILDQLLRFPTGTHDDAVDALSLFCLALDQAHPAIAVREPERPLTWAEKDMMHITGIDPRKAEINSMAVGQPMAWIDDTQESYERDRALTR